VQGASIVQAPIGSAGRINYLDEGPKTSTLTPVLFVHSFAGSANHWDAQIEYLRSKRRVVAIDLRGHGRSDPPNDIDGYSVASLASDIGTVADHLAINRFVLVGHSIGAAAALAYAQQHPGRVDSLVLVGAPGRMPPERSGTIMASLRKNYDAANEIFWGSLMDGARPETRALLKEGRTRMPREAALSLIDAAFAFDPVPAMLAYPGPKMIIDTRHSDSRNALYRQAPDVPRHVIAGTSHWPHLDKPYEFNRVLDSFL
jgi:pimeloyl-ACP methyl ester carboxylesterase